MRRASVAHKMPSTTQTLEKTKLLRKEVGERDHAGKRLRVTRPGAMARRTAELIKAIVPKIVTMRGMISGRRDGRIGRRARPRRAITGPAAAGNTGSKTGWLAVMPAGLEAANTAAAGVAAAGGTAVAVCTAVVASTAEAAGGCGNLGLFYRFF